MKRRLVILTEIISPYRIPLFNALARKEDVDLHVIFLAETDPSLRRWQVYKEEIKFSYQVLRGWRKRLGRYNALLNRGVARALAAAAPDVILCGGYSYVASWQTLFWARSRQIPFLLWSESTLQDLRRGRAVVELLKDEFLRGCSGFVVPGRSAREYLREHKIADDRIFTAPNAVDNDLFAEAADLVRQNAADRRRELGLPERYFLFVGRLVPEKGVFDLLSAYAKLDGGLRRKAGLVFVGDGTSRRQLEEQAASIVPGVIRFPGFAQREQLPSYYALAQALVLPTYTDTWGLVVNEAMACGLPVILSQAAGCAADLVKEEWNGLSVPPRDASALAGAMQTLGNQAELCVAMGANSRQHISRYSPAEWCRGLALAVAAAGGVHD
ncbi:MAG TPA: glycosyltransferase family 4 protein [Candidatus Sulfotelmatobacter sp.]|nr:glycosyltransferase family 4 protein [Candidatus Sulfotelmatobacter sp.]